MTSQPNSHLSGIRSGLKVFALAFALAIKPEKKLTVPEWADKHRVLSQKSSAEHGRWRNDRTPYLVEIMYELSPESSQTDIVVMKGGQVGGTECGNNWIGHTIDQNPGPMMVIWPTSNTAKRNSKQRLTPLIDETPCLSAKILPAKSRDSGNTTMMKEYAGGVLVIAGANSAAELKSMPMRFLFADEVDEYPDDVDGQGDALELAEVRTYTFSRRAKRLKVSTPTAKGFSRIDRLYEESDQRKYYVPCPHCTEKQVLAWEQIDWRTRHVQEFVCVACGSIHDVTNQEIGEQYQCCNCQEFTQVTDTVLTSKDTGEIIDVWYECEHCHEHIREHHKTDMLANGEWIAQNPGPNRAAGFHISGLYSPVGWLSWQLCVQKYLESEGKEDLRRAFTNNILGLAYEVDGDQPDVNELKDRAETTYTLGAVPDFALFLTAGVDVQKDRLEVKVKGYGPGEESALIDWQQIYGDTAQPEVWDLLADYLFEKRFKHASGAELKITATGVDTGYLSHMVYEFCRKYAHKHVLALKGANRPNRPIIGSPSKIDYNYRGKLIKSGVKLWMIGTDTGKSLIYGRLKIQEPGPGHCHFPFGLPDDYYDQLTAEKLITVYVNGNPKQKWVLPSGVRNEALDCENYAYAAAVYAGVTRLNWEKLRARICKPQQELFSAQKVSSSSSDVPEENESGGSAASPGQDASHHAGLPEPNSTKKKKPVTKKKRRASYLDKY